MKGFANNTLPVSFESMDQPIEIKPYAIKFGSFDPNLRDCCEFGSFDPNSIELLCRVSILHG